MPIKDTKLIITIATVDKATATIRAIRARLDALMAPVRAVGTRLSGAFSAVGGAIKSVISQIPILGAAIVGVAAGSVAALMSMVDGFSALGDKSKSIGVSVDFLAQMRFAASKSGATVEQLDAGLQKFSTSIGQARAGTGSLAAFLSKRASPALLKQLKATKSNEEALDLLANAMAKIPDPARRAALAAKAVGDPALAPLLARGANGIKELRERYTQLAGSQGEAVERSGEVDDAMKDLKASTDGIKAAIVVGLAPALKIIVKRLGDWFVKHRDDIAEFAASLGERIPAAVRAVVTWVENAIARLKTFLSTLVKIYNKINDFINLGDLEKENEVRERRLAFYRSQVEDGTAEEREKAAIMALTREDQVRERLKAQIDGVDWTTAGDEARFGSLRGRTSIYSVEELRALAHQLGPGAASRGFENMALINKAHANAPRQPLVSQVMADKLAESKAKIEIRIQGAPPGTRATIDPQSTADVNLNMGIQMLPGLGAP